MNSKFLEPLRPSEGGATCLRSSAGQNLAQEIIAHNEARYGNLEFIGQGSFASVWKAQDLVTGELVAIKRLEPRSRQGRDFYRELGILFRLKHPNIVQVINFREAVGGVRYLILEYCRGGNLRSELIRQEHAGSPPDGRAIHSFAIQFARALSAAHEVGVMHRDLKPENMLFAESPEAPRPTAKLADFGLSRMLSQAVGPQDGRLQGLSGSPAYMAPEQFAGKGTLASDIYSLGIVFYELWHGETPFVGLANELARSHLMREPEINVSLPAAWRTLLAEMLCKDPTRRPTAIELVRRLERQEFLDPIKRPIKVEVEKTLPTASHLSSPGSKCWKPVAIRCLGVNASHLLLRPGAQPEVVAVAGEVRFVFNLHDGRPAGVEINSELVQTTRYGDEVLDLREWVESIRDGSGEDALQPHPSATITPPRRHSEVLDCVNDGRRQAALVRRMGTVWLEVSRLVDFGHEAP